MKSIVRHLIALCFMGFGCAGVLGLVYYMNELSQPPAKEDSKAAKSFEVKKQPKKKKQVEKATPKKRKTTVRTAQAAPMPNISSAMSGMNFDLPQFENDALYGTDKLLESTASNKRLVMTGDSVDTLPRPRFRKAPKYPLKARERGIEGLVVLKIKVSERGDVEQVRVINSEPSGVFDMVAIAAVSDWTFEPAKYQGEPVAVSVSQRIPFRLK